MRDNYYVRPDGSLFALAGYETRAERIRAFKQEACTALIGRPLRDGIVVTKKSIKEWLNQPHMCLEEKDKMIFRIGELLQNARYIGRGEDIHIRGVKVHLYETAIGAGASWIVVREFKWGLQLHSVSDCATIVEKVKG